MVSRKKSSANGQSTSKPRNQILNTIYCLEYDYETLEDRDNTRKCI